MVLPCAQKLLQLLSTRVQQVKMFFNLTTEISFYSGNTLMHDPFAMRPFFGYNVGHYIEHWLSLPHRYSNAQLPKIFKVNWFRRDAKGGFLWPGFGENSRVIDWIIRRVENDDTIMEKTPIGYIPRKESFNLNGLKVR